MSWLPCLTCRGTVETYPRTNPSNGLIRLDLSLRISTRRVQRLRHLVLPTSHNGETDVRVLWIGFRMDTRELLVVLTIRLNADPERHYL